MHRGVHVAALLAASAVVAEAETLPGASTAEAQAKLKAGNQHYRLREFREAIASYKAGVALERRATYTFWYNLAQCHRQLGEATEATWYYRRFLAESPGTLPEHRAAAERFIAELEPLTAPAPAPAPAASDGPAGPAATTAAGAPSTAARAPARSPLTRARLALVAGSTTRNFSNDQGFDHRGLIVGLSPSYRIVGDDPDRPGLALGVSFRYQDLHKDLGDGVESEAQVGGLTIDVRGELPVARGRLQLRLGGAIGVAYYAAAESNDGTSGAEFSRNGMLQPLRDFGLRLGGAAGVCGLGGWVCLEAAITGDFAVNPDVTFVDGGALQFGFTPFGYDLTLALDPLAALR